MADNTTGGSILKTETSLNVAVLTAGFSVTDTNRKAVIRTARKALGQLPGSALPFPFWFPMWMVGVIPGIALGLEDFALSSLAGESTPFSVTSAGVVAAVSWAAFGAAGHCLPPLYRVFIAGRRENDFLLCDPGKAFMTARVSAEPVDGTWVITPKNLNATRKGRGHADHMVSALLERVRDAGNIRIEAKAQTQALAEKYYRDRYGFTIGPGRAITFPGLAGSDPQT